MTREQKIEAFTMKLDGKSYQAIADKFGVSKQCIQQMLIGGTRRSTFSVQSRGFIYPNLVEHMINKDIHTVSAFAQYLGINEKCPDCLSKKLKGETGFDIGEIRKVLAKTGLTFDEAFQISKIE
jgi:bacterioferritin-associated ferredoxin